MAKRATVDLAEDDEEEEEQTRHCARDEEILQTECWIETSENGQIGADRSEDSFCSTLFTNILKRKSGENKADHIETAKITFAAQQPKGRKFMLEHVCRILKGHSKWDAPKPLETDDHTEIFRPDVRPRPAGKTRPTKKTKSETTGSSGGSASGASGSISDSVSEELRRKL
ncbi:hypothetical protein Tco_0545836 [Tanacetum coccineum]